LTAAKDFVDADFEPVTKKKKKKVTSQKDDKDDFTTPYSSSSSSNDDKKKKKKNMIDVSLDMGDPEWKTTRIPFFHPTKETCIDGKLAFMVDIPMDGTSGKVISYGLAVPFDDAVAIVEEVPGKDQVTYIHPDNNNNNDAYYQTTSSSSSPQQKNDDSSNFDADESLELMEIFAAQVKEQLGEDLTLCKTPKVLTIAGGLDKYTQNWETSLIGQPATVQELLETLKTKAAATAKSGKSPEDEQDEDIAELFAFMKQELGEVEYQKTMAQDIKEVDLDEEMLQLFDVPGLGVKQDDLEGMQELINSMLVDLQEVEKKGGGDDNDDDDEKTTTLEKESAFITDPDFMDGAALKLISFNFPQGRKSYSLVKLLQPFVLIGKYIEDEEEDETGDMVYEEEDNDTATTTTTDTSMKRKRSIRFELLTAAEEKIVIPKLEQLCQKDLERAGLSL
jgi:hypothetical protein